jgi:hypothetical protein
VTLSDGDYRIMAIHKGPMQLYMRLDLGGIWGDKA